MPNVKLKPVGSREYKLAHHQEEKIPTVVLVAEELESDIAISIAYPAAKRVALARQVDLRSFPKIFDEVLSQPSDKKPPTLLVSFIGGGEPSEGVTLEETPGYQYVLEVIEILKQYAGSEIRCVEIPGISPSLKQIKLEGSRCNFLIVSCEILNKPHPNSVYLSAQLLEAQEYTPQLKKAFLSREVLSEEPISPLPSASLKVSASYSPLNKKRRLQEEVPELPVKTTESFQNQVV